MLRTSRASSHHGSPFNVRLMKRLLTIAAVLLLSGCGTLFVNSGTLCGDYSTEGLIWITWSQLQLNADGTFKLAEILYQDSSPDPEGPANVVFGRWTFSDGELLLLAEREEDERPQWPLGLEKRRFKVVRKFNHIRLISGSGKNAWVLRK